MKKLFQKHSFTCKCSKYRNLLFLSSKTQEDDQAQSKKFQKYSKDLKIVNKEGGKTLAEFPNSIELGKLGPGQDPNKNSHSTTSLV